MNSIITYCARTQSALIGKISKTAAAYSFSFSNLSSKINAQLSDLKQKLGQRAPIIDIEQMSTAVSPCLEKEPLKRWPNGVNPITGEIGGPAGPEPTRYGDWERKGIVSDF